MQTSRNSARVEILSQAEICLGYMNNSTRVENKNISEADLRRGRRGHAPPRPPTFCNHLFYAITLKNYKLCYLKLN